VFRCLLADQPDRGRRSDIKRDTFKRSYRDIDLLLMQVSIAINQSVFRQLRQISLDRLKISVGSLFPFSRQLSQNLCGDAPDREFSPGAQ
jgi:hypothetical protein